MRKTTIIWSLAALITVLLGTGIASYAQLGAASSRQPAAPTVQPPTTGVPSVAPDHPTTPPTTTAPRRAIAPFHAALRTPAASPKPTRRPATVAPRARRPASRETTTPAPTTDPIYVVHRRDTLWALAASHLGSPYKWVELFDLNRGRLEPGGQRIVDPNHIEPGWSLQFPGGATGLTAAPAGHAASPAVTAGHARAGVATSAATFGTGTWGWAI